jgi:hypothetical protein
MWLSVENVGQMAWGMLFMHRFFLLWDCRRAHIQIGNRGFVPEYLNIILDISASASFKSKVHGN